MPVNGLVVLGGENEQVWPQVEKIVFRVQLKVTTLHMIGDHSLEESLSPQFGQFHCQWGSLKKILAILFSEKKVKFEKSSSNFQSLFFEIFEDFEKVIKKTFIQ